jgi:hypothetical protein
VLGLCTKRLGRFAVVAADWHGMRHAALAAHVVNLLCNGANIIMSNPNGDHSLAFNTYVGPMDSIEANGLYTLPTVDVLTTDGLYSQNYHNKVAVCFAWYGPLLGTLAKFALICGTVALAPTDKIESILGYNFDLTRRGADSIVNYLFHYYAVYAFCLTGLYEEFTFGRYLTALAAAPLFAQFWMWRPVATFLKTTLIFPDVETCMLVDMDTQREDAMVRSGSAPVLVATGPPPSLNRNPAAIVDEKNLDQHTV